jgi:vacuolar-type H+-ATPase subunit H
MEANMTTTNNGTDKVGAAKDAGGRVAGSAQEQAGAVANTAKQQAGQVVSDAKSHAQQLAGQATDQLSTQASQQTQQLSSRLHEFSDELASMASSAHPGSSAATLVDELSQRGKRLASYLDSREPRDLVTDLQDLGRRRPGTFIAGAVVAGLIVGRLGKGAKNAPDQPTDTTDTTAEFVTAPQTITLESAPAGARTIEPPAPQGDPMRRDI